MITIDHTTFYRFLSACHGNWRSSVYLQCRADVMLALRSLKHIDQFDSMDVLKAGLLELDYPLVTQAKVEWRESLTLTQGGIEARKRDDFFATILLSTQPYSTCLSYRGGAYCNCLLACFDSKQEGAVRGNRR